MGLDQAKEIRTEDVKSEGKGKGVDEEERDDDSHYFEVSRQLYVQKTGLRD